MRPFSVVEQKEFVNLVKTLEPRYELPSRTFFSKTAVPKRFNEMKDMIIDKLKTARKFSCTSDMWSSVTGEPYLSLTVHYIDNWALKTHCLRTVFMPESHTGDNICNLLKDVLNEYGCDLSNVVSFTTDSGANMVKACRDMGVTRLPCFGHVLHNAITNSLVQHQSLNNLLKECRAIIGAFSHSYRMKSELAKIQKTLNLPQHQLIQDVSTRWGSKFSMMQRFYEQRSAVSHVLLNGKLKI